MQFSTIIVFFIPMVLARHHHRTLLEAIFKSKGNLFTKVDNDVQSVINSLFESLKLDENFVTRSRIKLLLTMHYDLKSMAEKNYDVHEKMIEVAKQESDNKTTNKNGLYELIEEILNDQHINLTGIKHETQIIAHHPLTNSDQTRTEKKLHEHIKFETDINISEPCSGPEFANSEEFKQFVKDFIEKIDNLSDKDFTKTSPAPTDEPDEDDLLDDDNPNVWKPPEILELDYVNDTDNRRIFKGRTTKIEQYPFMASIHLMDTFTCAGSVISDDLVISAASCLQLLYNNRYYRENPNSLYVRVGSDYYAMGGERIDVIETYFHPYYNPKTLANNLILLRLQNHLSFSRKQKRIKRIAYDRTQAHLATNTDGILVVGWGSKKQSQIIDHYGKLLVAQLDIYHIHECANIYSKVFVNNKNFCAGFISSGGGACNKDLGGPGIVSGKLVGVISFGAPVCGSIDSPTVFTKLGFYTKWIDEVRKTRPHTIAVKTTLQGVQPRFHMKYAHKYYITKNLISPITLPDSQNARLRVKSNDIRSLKNILNEIAHSNNSALQDVLYGDTDEDILDMFKPTEKIDPIQHPLANKTFFLLPEIHTFAPVSTEYSTVALTTSVTILPNPTAEPPATTIITTSREPVTLPEYDITDFRMVSLPTSPTPTLEPAVNIGGNNVEESYEDAPKITTKHTRKHKKRSRHHHYEDGLTEAIVEDYYNNEAGGNSS